MDITETTKNNVSFTNLGDAGDILVNDATMLVDDADRLVDSVGTPITETTKNNVSFTNNSENI